MNRIVLLSFFVSISISSFSQSANIDKENFYVSYVKLPTNPILDDTKRTYSSNSRTASVSGFSKVKSPGTLDFEYRFNGTKAGEYSIEKIKHEKKDDDGKVISTTYTYIASSFFNSSGTLVTINALTGQSTENNFKDSSGYEGPSFSSYGKAEEHYNNNKYDIKDTHSSEHEGNIRLKVESFLDRTYGYVPYESSYEYFWILGSKKHPEYPKHQEAFNTLKVAFEEMKYDVPMDKIQKEVEPVIEYFNSIIPNYEGTKRKMKKVKYASFYNIAKIYYYLDMPNKVKEYAQKIIDNDYSKSDGKEFMTKADQLAKILATNKVKSRHMNVLTEDLSNIPDEVEEKKEEKKETPPANFDLNKAYLITQKNDTILVDINSNDIPLIGYSIKTVEFDKDGRPIATRNQSAKNCKELLFPDGLHYKNVKFKESSVKSGEIDAAQMLLGGASDKICKVLYESEKIGLYLFKDNEMVIFPKTRETGKSTLSTAFVFGFKKNMTKIAEGCLPVQEKARNNEYENTKESLLKFCKEYTECAE